MNKEAQIGLLVLVFMIASVGLAYWLKGNPFQDTKTIEVLFDDVHGLRIGSPVEYAGLKCGTVKDFEVVSKGILTHLEITKPEIEIHRSDKFLVIPSSTIASEYQIFIVPGDRPSEVVSEDSVVLGQTPPGFKDVLFGFKEALQDIRKATKQTNNILVKLDRSVDDVRPLFRDIGNLSKQGKFRNLVNDANATVSSLNSLASRSDRILATNQQDLSTIISNSRAISADLKEKLEAVESKDLREAFDSMRVSLNNLEHISGAIDPKQLKRDLEELDKALQAFADMRSQDPDRDVPNLIRRTMQRIDRMTAALEREAQEESLLRLMLSDLDIDRDPRPSHADSEPACR